jgi:DNA repair exonuclease SbcCD ATPase subunit
VTLLNVSGTDFCAFGSFSQRLDKRGLVWLGGENRDTKAASSNGASKTSFFKAISWGLFGKTIDGKDGDEVIREGQKKALVKVKIRDTDSTIYTAIRSRRKGSPKVELWREGDAEALKGSKDEIQSQINRLVGMDFTTFRNVVLYGQRDLQRFIAPETPDADRKKVLQGLLRTQIYSTAHDWIKKQLTELNAKITVQKSKLDRCSARIEEYDLGSIAAEQRAWIVSRDEAAARARTAAKEALEEAKRLAEEMPDVLTMERDLLLLRKRAGEAAALEKSIEEHDKFIAARKQESKDAAKDSHRLTLEIAGLRSRLADLDKGVCPVCNTPSTGVDYRKHVEQLKDEKKQFEDELRANHEKVAALSAAIIKLQADRVDLVQKNLDDFDGIEEQIAEKREEIARAEGSKGLALAARKRARELLAEAKAKKELESPHAKRLEAAKVRLRELRAEVFVATAELKGLETERLHYEFWNRGYGPSGLPSFVLDSIMPYLTDRTNHYLETLADGDITMNFSTQVELKSAKGEVRDKIGIDWEIEGTTGKPPSGGQFKKMEIATTFAMMDLVATRDGATLDLLLLDEALDGVDEEGYSRIIDLLHKLRTTRKSIFVISHSGEIGEIFERGLLVVKEGGEARIEKVA